MTLDELLALLPDEPPGNIAAADLRTIVTDLSDKIDSLTGRVTVLEGQSNLETVPGHWQFSPSLPPPTGNQLRLNNADATLATEAHFRVIDNGGNDRTVLFGRDIVAVRIQDSDNAANFVIYNVTGPATIAGGTAVLPVTFNSGGGPLPAQKVLAVFAVNLETP